MKILLTLIFFPIVIIVALLMLFVGFIAWVFGLPLTLKFPGGRKEVYRWFTRIE